MITLKITITSTNKDFCARQNMPFNGKACDCAKKDTVQKGR